MHCVHTSSALWLPLAVETFTRCRFGLNVRRVMPVTFVPTPPKYFFLPRVVTWLPSCRPLPQTSHCRAIAYLDRSNQLSRKCQLIETRKYNDLNNLNNRQNTGGHWERMIDNTSSCTALLT